MADAVVSILLEKLVTFLIAEGRQLLDFEDQFDEIRKEFQYMQNYIKDADRVKRRDRTETLKLIMNDVRELIYDVEDIIADCQLLSQKKKTGVGIQRLRDINKRIREVKLNMVSYLATVPVHGRKEVSENIPLTYPVLMTEDKVVGLEDESNKIIDWLLVENEYLQVVGIVGMGGIGKTTLAQKICKSDVIETNFRHLIFVTVSQSFRFDELLKKMLNKQGVADELLHGKGIDDLLEILKNELDDKYLIVLDDVWGVDEGQWWESLESALPKEKGGCIMVTTRNEEVARSVGAIDEHIYPAEILSDENSWSLFCRVAFARNGGISPNEKLEKHGKEIVARCGGLPLTIKTVGGMLMGKGNSISEWERISKHLKEEMTGSKKDEVVISRLELSYEELPMHLRSCLLCFAIFPEDRTVATFQIINMWIAEGFVWGRSGKTATEVGEECLNELCNRCLILKDDEERFGGGFSYYEVHDAVREMLIKIAIEENFCSMKCREGPMANMCRRAVICEENTAQERIGQNSDDLRMLAWFNAKHVTPILDANLKKLRRLRMLHLQSSRAIMVEGVFPTTWCYASKWLEKIGSLQHLVYLHLQNIDALATLPDSIGNLSNLQILNINDCPNLASLPPSITMLEKLIALNVFECPSLECLPKGLGKLSNLEQLICVKSADENTPNSWMSLPELKKLKKLRLLIMEISGGEQVGKGEFNFLQMPESLRILCLLFPGVNSADAAGIARKIDHPLRPPLQCLKELLLSYYPGESIPAWLSPACLPNLQYLCINGGRVKNMGEGFLAQGGACAWKVETLVLEDWVSIERVMPFLRIAHVKNCPKLKYPEEAFQLGTHGWRTLKKYIRSEQVSFLYISLLALFVHETHISIVLSSCAGRC
ncbi:hypothetical protein ACLOJK_021879 [Asimina triloba]